MFVLDAGDLAFDAMDGVIARKWRLPLARALATGARRLAYDATALGEQDLDPPPAVWADNQTLPWVASDLVDADGRPPFPTSRIIAREGVRIGVVALAGSTAGQTHDASVTPRATGWRVVAPAEALREAVGHIRAQVDVIVLLTHVFPSSIPPEALAGIDVIVNAHGRGASIAATPPVYSLPSGGQSVGIIHVPILRSSTSDGTPSANPVPPPVGPSKSRLDLQQICWEVVPILRTENPDPSLVRLTDDALKKANALAKGLLPSHGGTLVAPPVGYAGAEQCRSCHAPQFDQWSTTAHAHALDTLALVSQDGFPACIQCHVTGLPPATLRRETALASTPTPTGTDTQNTPRTDHLTYLPGVQCEACHGPGLAHVRAPARVHLSREVPQATCLTCHDPRVDNGRFDPQTYYSRVRH